MKPQKLLLLATILCIVFTACQKELSEEEGFNPPPPPNTVADSNYISKIFLKDSSFSISGIEVDSSVMNFTYDNQKRLSQITIKEYLNSPDSLLFVQFYYHQNDTLPYRANHLNTEGIYYFFYDNLGRMIKDSVIMDRSAGGTPNFSLRKGMYSYAPGKIYTNISDTNFSNQTIYFAKDTLSLDSRGNVINAKFYSENIASTGFELRYTATSTFDNNVSPYLKTPSYRMFIFSYNIFFENFQNIFTTNNLSSYSHFDGTNALLWSSNYVNSYYPNGFLKKFDNPGVDFSDHRTFVYTAL